MKKNLPIILSSLALAGVIALAIISCTGKSCKKSAQNSEQGQDLAGAIVYFDLDRVINEYDMANDLQSVFQTKVESINQEVNRRGTKLEKDIKAFQDKVDKGLLTRSVAEAQSEKLQQQQQTFQNYAAQKQQEIAEENQVMMNQIADAIREYVVEFNADRQYAAILTTQGEILQAPVVCADESLDITDELVEGLNAAYVQKKGDK